MPPVVTIAIPVLRRPHRARLVVESLAAVTPNDMWQAVFAVSPSDVVQYRACMAVQREFGPDHVGIVVMDDDYEGRGDYARKINAVARLRPPSPWLFTGADDVRFHPAWLSCALVHAASGVGVIGTNDRCNKRVQRGEHSTHSFVARWYIDEHGTIDEPGVVMHEGYPHECCDDEMVQTAMSRGAFVWAGDSMVEHLHPTVGKARWDATYVGATNRPDRMRQGNALLAQRRTLWA